MNTRELRRYSATGPDWVEARIELHRRLALPIACLVLALVGIPLGVSSRKGGKSGGYVTAVFLAFFCYYLAFITLVSLARAESAAGGSGALAAECGVPGGRTDCRGAHGNTRRPRFCGGIERCCRPGR